MIKRIMIKLLQNTIYFILSIIVVVTITFFIFEIIPGDVYDLDTIKNENVLTNIRNKYGLDQPVFTRYIKMIKNTFALDFGNSFINEGRSVNEIISKNFTVSIKLGVPAIIVSLICGSLTGINISKLKNKNKRKLIILILVGITSVPTFVIAALLQYIITVKLRLLPVYGLDTIGSYVIPVIILSITPTIFIARLLERKIVELNDSDYVIAAKARGQKKSNIMIMYIIKNSLTPILSYMAPLTANLIVGSFVVETIFNIPGLGRYFIVSVTNRDYPVVMGLTVFFSTILIVTTAVFNVLISIVDYKGDLNGEKYKKRS